MAAAWVTLKHLGQDGYMKIAEKLQKTVKILIDGCNNIEVSFQSFDLPRRSRWRLTTVILKGLVTSGIIYCG